MTPGMSGRCFKWNQNAALCISGLQKLAKGSLNEAFRGRAPMVGWAPIPVVRLHLKIAVRYAKVPVEY